MNQRLPSDVKPNVIPRFKAERVPIKDQYDAETGLPSYVTVETVTFLIPGDKTSAPSKKVTPEIKRLWAEEYNAWKRSGDQASMEGGGLPLNKWPHMPKEVAAGLIHANIYTVEQLANLSDSQCQIKGTIGLRKYRDMALAFIDSSKAAAPIAKLSAENEAQQRRISLLEDQLKKSNEVAEKLSARLDELQGTPALAPPPQPAAQPEEAIYNGET